MKMRKTGVCQRAEYPFKRVITEYEEQEDGSEIGTQYLEIGIRYRSVFLMYYNNITRGRAKRIARNHRLGFKPRDCGIGYSKMKDKIYFPCASIFVYTSHNRKLFIRVQGDVRTKVISKTIYKEEE